MKISIITPCYNASEWIERAIQSVKSQDYLEWEHIVVDGKSNDGTLDILAKHPHLRVVSEEDNGQADAMNKGYQLAKGEIIGFLNADDYYFPGALTAIANAFDEDTNFVVGNVLVKSKRLGSDFLNTPRTTLEGMMRHWEPNAFCYNPVGYFYRKAIQDKCPFNPDNYASMDLEFLLDAASITEFKKIDFTLGCFDDGHDTKTDKTQLKPDYWRPTTFPYIDKKLSYLSAQALEHFLEDRRTGYQEQQRASNARAKERRRGLPPTKHADLISVIIPNYNNRETIGRAITSVLEQSHSNLEIIVVDDCSTDDSIEYITTRFKDPRIKIFQHDQNHMLGAARNTGITQATGSYLFFLDSDDFLLPEALATLLASAKECNADITQGSTLRITTQGRSSIFHQSVFASDGGIDGLRHFAEHQFASVAWNKLYKQDLFQGSDGVRFINKYMHEDVPFAMECVFRAQCIISIDAPVICYTENTNSLTQKKPTRLNIESYLFLYTKITQLCEAFDLFSSATGSNLAKKILASHGAEDIIPKLLNCRKTMGHTDFQNTLFDIGLSHAGPQGAAVATLIGALSFAGKGQHAQKTKVRKDPFRSIKRFFKKISPKNI
jgi:glycosyltransferase involved in cell wall biosynthesis